MEQFDKEKINLVKEFINSLTLQSDDKYVEEAFKKITDLRKKYNALTIKNDEEIGKIINLRYKSVLLHSEESL
jgi:hypothetical protein